jgi:hypothetical protein
MPLGRLARASATICIARCLGLRVAEARIVEYEPGKKFTVEFTAGPVKGSKVTYSLESIEGKTKLTPDLELRLSGLWRLMQPVLTRREVRDREAGVANVKRILEARTTSKRR